MSHPTSIISEPGMRASDADRERIVQTLRAATGAGMLTLAEADERLAAAYAARYQSELPPLVADITAADTTTPRSTRGIAGQVTQAAQGLFARLLPVLMVLWALAQRHKLAAAAAVGIALVAMVALARMGMGGPEGMMNGSEAGD